MVTSYLPYVIGIVTTIFTKAELNSEKWGYVSEESWKGTCNTGLAQSPIDLDLADIEITHWEPLHFNDYNVQGNIEAENNGHTELVQGFKSWSARPSISGGGLGSRYFLSQFHFHWDGNDRFGSEHTLNGLHYPLEIHFVHIREDLNESNADLIPGGIAVVAVAFEVAKNGEALLNLTHVLAGTTGLNLKENLQWYSPNSLLPKDRSTFFRYNGSLTTPPCSEGVSWTILTEPNYVSEDQLQILRSHLSEDGSLLIHNWRETQPMNGRKLYLNVNGHKSASSFILALFFVSNFIFMIHVLM